MTLKKKKKNLIGDILYYTLYIYIIKLETYATHI